MLENIAMKRNQKFQSIQVFVLLVRGNYPLCAGLRVFACVFLRPSLTTVTLMLVLMLL